MGKDRRKMGCRRKYVGVNEVCCYADMPKSVLGEYKEARVIFGRSPRAQLFSFV